MPRARSVYWALASVLLSVAASGAAAEPPSLLAAAKSGAAAEVHKLLEGCANPNEADADGASALHWAVHRGAMDGVRALLARGAAVDAENRYGIRPAYLAAENGDAAAMRVLLEAGALWRPVDARAINDVRRNLLDCDAEVTLEVIDALMKHNACPRETIEALLKTPAIKRHVAEIQRKLDRLGFDARTKEQKEEEARQKEQYRRWALDTYEAVPQGKDL